MVGSKIPVLEIENYLVTKDGRGILMYDDGVNAHIGDYWTGISSQATGADKKFFSAPSSSGYIGVHIISGSTYGPTGAIYYIPLYSALDINNSS